MHEGKYSCWLHYSLHDRNMRIIFYIRNRWFDFQILIWYGSLDKPHYSVAEIQEHVIEEQSVLVNKHTSTLVKKQQINEHIYL